MRPVYLSNLKYGSEEKEKEKQYSLNMENIMYLHETPDFRMEKGGKVVM